MHACRSTLEDPTALVLLVAAGLMIRTLGQLRASELGFRPDRVLTLRTALPASRYREPAQRLDFYNRVLDGVRTLPGVESAAYGSMLPFMSLGNTNWFQIEGATAAPDPDPDALRRVGTPAYLRTLGAEAIEGRLLDERDVAGAPLAAVINATMAHRNLPGASAIGHRIRFDPDPGAPAFTIVGVIRDVRERGYAPALKQGVYLSVGQLAQADFSDNLIVRTSAELPNLVGPIRRVIAGIDPEQPVSDVRPLAEILDLDIADRQQQMLLLGMFAALAVLLASIGVYGVLSYLVTQRTREIGVRIALGASRGSVVRSIVGRGAALTGIGLGIGLVAAWMTAQAMRGLLYGVSAADPSTFVSVVLLLGAIALGASYGPARRATRVDPIVALRSE